MIRNDYSGRLVDILKPEMQRKALYEKQKGWRKFQEEPGGEGLAGALP